MTAWAEFTEHNITVPSVCGDISIFARKGGSGPGLLLLHGHPQTSHIWRFVAPHLASTHTVICADLRGYGRSAKPSAGSAKTSAGNSAELHVEYSKREMANDAAHLMASFGFSTFDVLAHDRGARVAHRLVLDHPALVKRLCLLDIAPTLFMYENTNMDFAMSYWHWFFLPQPAPGPENVMLADPEKYWNMLAGRLSHKGVKWAEEDVAEYKKWYFTPEGVHGACEDYRAAATIDLTHDRASRDAGQRMQLDRFKILWGAEGVIAKYSTPDALEVWRAHCEDGVEVTGGAVPGGHYIPEHVPERLEEELEGFFAR